MIDFIPLDKYAPLFFNVMLLVVFIVWLNSRSTELTNNKSLKSKAAVGILLLVLLVPYIGLRPVSGQYFGDTQTYANTFTAYSWGAEMTDVKDIGFDSLMKFCSSFMDINQFFLLCAFLFLFPMYIASKKLFKEYWFYSFVILLSSFSFWGAATNGVRTGVATSLILLAFAFRDKKVIAIVLMLIAVSFHKSMLLPLVAYAFTAFYRDTKMLLLFWFLCIPASIAMGSTFETVFELIGFADRASDYLTDEFNEQFSRTGFRWDFLLYSATAVFAGWFFIVKKKFDDPLYIQLFNTYLIANAFWILVIRASFSNRFAYLSWFMMGLIIVYPFLKVQFFKHQHQILGNILMVYFMFTYVLNVILVK
ncbi:MAG TPA: EpsG family protein [Flavobacterium sp.]|jgi:hypothetical protein